MKRIVKRILSVFCIVRTRRDMLGQEMPRGYRIGYYDVIRQVAYLFPVGIHWLVGLAIRVWDLTFLCSESKREKLAWSIRSEFIERLELLERQKNCWMRMALAKHKDVAVSELVEAIGFRVPQSTEGSDEAPQNA